MDDTGVSYRLGGPPDVPAAARIVKLALDELAARQRQPAVSPEGEPMVPALLHVLDQSPDRFWIAEEGSRPIGFGAGFLRGDVCYLAGLFIVPEWQGRGVGHELLRRAMAGIEVRDLLPVVGSSGSNTVSNGLYARHGMYPQLPWLSLAGIVPESLADVGKGRLRWRRVTIDDLDELRELDLYVTGIDRSADHLWLMEDVCRPGWTFGRNGVLVGYAYLGGDGTVAIDHVGPCATRHPRDMAPVLAAALVEHGVGRHAVVDVPGPNLVAQGLLWGAGFQLDHSAGLLGSRRPFGRFDRYVFAGNVLM